MGLCIGGWATWINFILGGTLYPLIDSFKFKERIRNEETNLLSINDNFLIWIYSYTHIFILMYALYHVSEGKFQVWEALGLVLSLATVIGGVGIPAAHELIHSTSKMDRGLGLFLLSSVLYMHFRIEHIHGHHKNVATPKDPATARYNESLWFFIIRSFWGQIRNAVKIEQARVSNSGGKLKNRFHIYMIIQLALIYVIWIAFGLNATIVFIAQASLGIFFLETINYIEHYGLERKLKPNGKYEKVSICHSWNTGSLLTNALFFNLGFHSDHHMHPSTKYRKLSDCKDAPQLPAGYITMILVASFPPLWKKIMNKRVQYYHK